MNPEILESRLEYIHAHSKEIHLFGARADGIEVCIIHGEKKAPWGWKPNTQPVLEDF